MLYFFHSSHKLVMCIAIYVCCWFNARRITYFTSFSFLHRGMPSSIVFFGVLSKLKNLSSLRSITNCRFRQKPFYQILLFFDLYISHANRNAQHTPRRRYEFAFICASTKQATIKRERESQRESLSTVFGEKRIVKNINLKLFSQWSVFVRVVD